MHVRAGVETDLEAVARIQAASPEAAQWDLTGYPLLILEMDGGQVGGFLAWRETAPGEVEILNLAIHPDCRRHGLALALLGHLSSPLVLLEVRESNWAARALYRKAGFAEAGIRYGYYQSPPESAIVMSLKR